MADISLAQLTPMTQALQALLDEMKGLSNTVKESVVSEGITEPSDTEKELTQKLTELTESQEKLFKEALGPSSEFIKVMKEVGKTVEKSAETMVGGSNTEKIGNDKEKGDGGLFDGKLTLSKDKPSTADVVNLDENFGLGSLLIYYKLDDIHKTLLDNSSGEKKKSGGGLGDIFAGLLKGASGIALLAISLIVMAGALLLFNLIQWDPAINGLIAFGIFTVGMIVIAKLVGNNAESFYKFGLGSLALSGSLVAFSVGIVIASLVKPFLETALPVVAGFLIFITAIAGVSRILRAEQANILDFAKSSVFMSAGLAAFSISLVIASYVYENNLVNNALPVVVGFLAFLVGISLVTRLLRQEQKNLIQFAISSLLLTSGIALFSLAILAADFVAKNVDFMNVLLVVGSFIVFVALMIGLSILANSFAGNFLLFGITSLVLSASLIAFAFTLGFISDTWEKIGGSEGLGDILKFLGFTVAIMAGCAVIGAAGILLIPAFAIFGIVAGLFVSVFRPFSEVLTNIVDLVIKMGQLPQEALTNSTDQIVKLFTHIILPMMDKVSEVAGEIKLGAAVRMKVMAESILPITEALSNVVDIVIKMASMKGDVFTTVSNGKEKQLKLSVITESLIGLFEKIIQPIMQTLIDQSKSLGLFGKGKLEAVSQSVLPISESLGGLLSAVQTVVEMEDFDVDTTKDNLKQLFGIFTDKDSGILYQLQGFGGLSNKVKETVDKLPGISDAIKSIAGMTKEGIDLSNAKAFDAIGGLATNINKFNVYSLDTLSKSLKNIQTLDIKPTLQPLIDLTSDANLTKFQSLADKLNSVADAIKRIADEKGALSDLNDLDGGSDLNSGAMGSGISNAFSRTGNAVTEGTREVGGNLENIMIELRDYMKSLVDNGFMIKEKKQMVSNK